MEDQKNIKINNAAADLPDVPRLEDGTIDLEKIIIKVDDKGNKVIPDNIFDAYYKELPAGTVNESYTWRSTATGGKIKILSNTPEDNEIRAKGREANISTWIQRRTSRQILEELSQKSADPETIERLGLEKGTSNLEAANMAQFKKAAQGDTKAMEYIRDTMGEKPATEVNATIEEITPEDKELLQRVNARLNSNT